MRRAVPIVLGAEVALLGFLYLYFCHRSGPFGFPLDDSWIHAVFARNIAEGKGIVYNVGQPMTSTAMLYSLLLAGLYTLTKAPIANAIALGLMLHFGSGVLAYLVARRLSLSPALSLSSAALLVAIPRLVWGAVSGMEVPLYVFLVCLGIYWHTRYTWADGVRASLSTLAFALAVLARPECAVFVACSVADRLSNFLRYDRKRSWTVVAKSVVLDAVVLCAVIAPLALYNIHAYGKPLPPAFYAKVHAPSAVAEDGVLGPLARPASFAWAAVVTSWALNPVLCLLLVPGLVFCLRAARNWNSGGILLLPLAFVCVPIATGIAAPTAGEAIPQFAFQHGRYSGYLAPLLVLLGVAGLAEMCRVVRRPGVGRMLTAGALAVAALISLAANYGCAQRYALEVQNINDMQVTFGRWAAGLPNDTVLAVNDAGAIPYFSRLRVLDTVGVVNPGVVPFLRSRYGQEIGLLMYLRKCKPEYVIIFPDWYPNLTSLEGRLHPVKSITLKHNVVCGGSEMVAYRATW